VILRPLTLAAALLALGAGPALAQEPSASLPDIEDEVMCPICGTALNLSEAPQADREREFIRRRIDEGLSKEEIKDALVAEYGSEVLATPDTEGFDLAAWVVPGLAILLAAGALSVGIRRWRSGGDGPTSGGEASSPVADPAGEAELDADLTRYRL
jgi:cytochrome c-type biogenesis protein CcmH